MYSVGICRDSARIPTDPYRIEPFFWCFGLNKSVLETTETKQADSQLSFATKIIKIELLIFENELIEDAMPALTDQESSKSEKT